MNDFVKISVSIIGFHNHFLATVKKVLVTRQQVVKLPEPGFLSSWSQKYREEGPSGFAEERPSSATRAVRKPKEARREQAQELSQAGQWT